jgi:hypothetical protein
MTHASSAFVRALRRAALHRQPEQAWRAHVARRCLLLLQACAGHGAVFGCEQQPRHFRGVFSSIATWYENLVQCSGHLQGARAFCLRRFCVQVATQETWDVGAASQDLVVVRGCRQEIHAVQEGLLRVIVQHGYFQLAHYLDTPIVKHVSVDS